MFQQQVLAGPTLMEEVKRINMVIVCPNQRAEFAQYNIYTIDVDWGNRNCYNYREFEYLAKNCRNKGNRIGEGRRLEYGQGNKKSNLNKERDLIVFN